MVSYCKLSESTDFEIFIYFNVCLTFLWLVKGLESNFNILMWCKYTLSLNTEYLTECFFIISNIIISNETNFISFVLYVFQKNQHCILSPWYCWLYPFIYLFIACWCTTYKFCNMNITVTSTSFSHLYFFLLLLLSYWNSTWKNLLCAAL